MARSQAEYDEWHARLREAVPDEDIWPPPQPWLQDLEFSWQQLFVFDLHSFDWDKRHVWSRKVCVEAVFETLRLSDVRSITRFCGALDMKAVHY